MLHSGHTRGISGLDAIEKVQKFHSAAVPKLIVRCLRSSDPSLAAVPLSASASGALSRNLYVRLCSDRLSAINSGAQAGAQYARRHRPYSISA